MREQDKARKWLAKNGLTQRELAVRTGYTALTVNWALKGINPPRNGTSKQPIAPWVWQRFKATCGDVDAEINGRKAGEKFEW